MEPLILVPILGLLALYIAYKELLNIAYRQWQAEMDLFKRRLAVYDQLKSAVGRVSAGGAVSPVDTERFAQAMSDMRFLFDEDLERFVGRLYDARLRSTPWTRCWRRPTVREGACRPRADRASPRRIEPELASQISNGIYRECRTYGKVHAAPACAIATDAAFRRGAAIKSSCASRLSRILSRGVPRYRKSFRACAVSAIIRNDLLVSV